MIPTIERSSTKARVTANGHTLVVQRAGPLDSDAWPDWWLCETNGMRLRRVRDLDSGIYTARVTLACRDAVPVVRGELRGDYARVNWVEDRPADLLNGGRSVKR